MSKSKLGQSLMRTIDGGKYNEGSTTDNGVDDAFEQASQNCPDEIIPSDEPIEAPVKDKPEKVKTTKQKKSGGFIGVIAIVLSFVALGIAGYSVINQKAIQVAAQKNLESLDTAIGSLNTKTDELTVNLADTQNDVMTNSDRLVELDGIREDILNMKETIRGLRNEQDGFKDFVNQRTSIEKNQKEIEVLGEKIKNINARAASVPKKVVRRMSVKKPNADQNLIEGAYAASIDLWGTRPYVMLREENGSWVPLAIGDYYKGWKLKSAIGSEAVFRKGSKAKRLTIKD